MHERKRKDNLKLLFFLSCRLEVGVENTIFHAFREKALWNSTEASFDIALLRLNKEVDITVHTPVCLPVLGKDYISPDNEGTWRWAKALGKKR